MIKSPPTNAAPPTRSLSGVEKVTAVLLAVGKPSADMILRQLDNAELREVTRSALKLPEVELELLREIALELEAELEKGRPLAGSTESTKELLTGVVTSEQIDDMLIQISDEPAAVWSRLSKVPAARLATFIAEEQPQVAAYLLSSLDAQMVSQVLMYLNPDLRGEISARLLTVSPIGAEAERLLAVRIAEDILGVEEQPAGANAHAKLGAILNNLERDQVYDVLGRLPAADAAKIRTFIFSFEDLGTLTVEDRSKLFDAAGSEQLILALRGCDGEFAEMVLSALSPRSRRVVESELSAGADPPQKAITQARRNIAAKAIELAEKSVIKLRSEIA